MTNNYLLIEVIKKYDLIFIDKILLIDFYVIKWEILII